MKKKLITSVFLFVFGCICNMANAADYYVIAGTGTGGTGSSWTDAMVGTSGLKTAISNALYGDVIHVAAGEYKLTSVSDAFTLKMGVKVLGGYPAAGGDSRDRDANPTILSGQFSGTGTSTSQRVYHVIIGTGDISGGLYDGFIVEKGGNSNYGSTTVSPTSNGYGGGVILYNITNAGTEPVLNNMLIRDCMAHNGGGLAIVNNSSTPVNPTPVKVTNLEVATCTTYIDTSTDGGGIVVEKANVDFENITVQGNGAHRGSGLAINSSSNAVLKNITAINNTCTLVSGYNTANSGAGIYVGSGATATMEDVTADGNIARGAGGGITVHTATAFIKNATVKNNSATSGGGMYFYRSTVTMNNITVTDNQGSAGGGINGFGSIIDIDVLTLKNNQASGSGGGLYVSGTSETASPLTSTSFKLNNAFVQNNVAEYNGGGIYLTVMNKDNTKRPVLNNITLIENKALSTVASFGNGGGLYITSVDEPQITNITVKNNVAQMTVGGSAGSNGGGMYLTSVKDVYVDSAVVTGNIAGYGTTRCSYTNGNGGGIYNTSSKGDIGGIFKNITISNNQAHNAGGGMYNTSANLTLINFCINNNRASNGGGIVNTTASAGDVNIDNGVILVATNGMINNNIAHSAISSSYGYGGGMYNTTASLTMSFVEVVGNHAENRGGGMFNSTCHWQKFYNLLIADNFSRACGGGIHNTTCHNKTSSYINDGSQPTYINCTIAGNYAAGTYSSVNSHRTSGGGIHNTTTYLILQNCIVYNNYGQPDNGSSPVDSDIAIAQLAANVGTYYDTEVFNSLVGAVEFNDLMVSGRFATTNSLYGVNPMFAGQAPAALLSSASFSPGAGSDCPETMANGTLNHDPAYFSGNYRLQSGSPCFDSGNNSYLSILPEWTKDLDGKDRIQNGIVDMGAFEGIGGSREFECYGCALGECPEECPPVVIWTPGADANNWNNPNNWRPQLVPGECTTVYIPGNVDSFPYLFAAPGSSEAHVCDKIIFLQGGEVGRQDLLTYNKAYIQYNMSHHDYAPNPTAESTILATEADAANDGKAKPINLTDHLGLSADDSKSKLSRNQWHMLSAPIREAVSGDFAFGGYPRTFMRRFIVQTEGAYPVGQFTETFATENVPLKAGEGFAYWMNEYRNGQDLYMEYGVGDDPNVTDLRASAFGVAQREYGVKVSNGVIQLPYFYDNTLVMSRRIASHSLIGNTTTFYYYWNGNPGIPVEGSVKDMYARTDAAYRLYDSPITYSVNVGVSQGFLLIGNPFMSTIDFQKFYADNSAFLYPSYKLYDPVSKTYFEYMFSPEVVIGDIDRYIAPLQGFFVQLKQGISTADLIFNISDISIVRPTTSISALKSSKTESGEKNTIRIDAVNEYSSSQVIIAMRENASRAYDPDIDVNKLFSNNGGVPDVFTLADGYPLAMNFTDNEAVTIPIGIRTQATENTTLLLRGMDGYDAEQILFIDSESGMKYDLTHKTSFEYPFTNTVSGVLNDRFFLQLSKSPTSMEDVLDYSSLINIYSSDNKIIITSSADNPIQQIYLYNVRGSLLQSETPSGSTYVALNENFPKNSLVIAKIVTEKQTKTAKLICK